MATTLEEVAAFLTREADLMDNHRFDEWFGLWTKECRYWVPCNEEDGAPEKTVTLIYETYSQLEDRLFRLKGRHAHAQSPKSRLLRVVGNINLEESSADGAVVRSNFTLGEVRSGRQDTWFGRSRHTLVREGGALRIREKKVFVLNNDLPMNNLTFLV